MDLPRLSHHLREELIAFTWGQWSQMGLLTTRQERSPWAQDPEALIVFTLEVARGEPRLFDELMDWALLNEPLLSVRRLRAMCIDDTDQMLVTAALEWLASQRPRARLQSGGGTPATATLQPLFRAEGPAGEIEASFAVAGLRRAPLSPSHKSRPPDPTQPINLAFRLRQILGVGIRAETIRVLLGIGAPWVTAAVLARATCYSKRNVHDALAGLTNAQVVSAVSVGGEQRYAAERHKWAALLGIEPGQLPIHRDWPQLLSALRRILRWSEQAELASLSDYLIASRARDLLEAVRPELAFAGIGVSISSTAEGAWRDLTKAVEGALAAISAMPGRG
jgi:hypothetical protein